MQTGYQAPDAAPVAFPAMEWLFRWQLDYGRCIACGTCSAACSSGAIKSSGCWEAAVLTKGDLVLQEQLVVAPEAEVATIVA